LRPSGIDDPHFNNEKPRRVVAEVEWHPGERPSKLTNPDTISPNINFI
jgi:hypothetical protein